MLAPVDILLFLITGFVAGAFGGLLGLGGAIILVPALTLGFGLPVHMAIAVSLVSNVFVAATQRHRLRKEGAYPPQNRADHERGLHRRHRHRDDHRYA